MTDPIDTAAIRAGVHRLCLDRHDEQDPHLPCEPCGTLLRLAEDRDAERTARTAAEAALTGMDHSYRCAHLTRAEAAEAKIVAALDELDAVQGLSLECYHVDIRAALTTPRREPE